MIPGLQDVCASGSSPLTLPRAPLSAAFTAGLRSKVKDIHFATNPCRIRYWGHEMLFFREDLAHKLRRNCVIPPRTDTDVELTEHLVKTVCSSLHVLIYISSLYIYIYIYLSIAQYRMDNPNSPDNPELHICYGHVFVLTSPYIYIYIYINFSCHYRCAIKVISVHCR